MEINRCKFSLENGAHIGLANHLTTAVNGLLTTGKRPCVTLTTLYFLSRCLENNHSNHSVPRDPLKAQDAAIVIDCLWVSACFVVLIRHVPGNSFRKM